MDRLLLTVIVGVVVSVSADAATHTKDSPAEVKKAVESGKAILIDVRESSEWNEGHLDMAKNIPLSEFKGGVPVEKLKALIAMDKIIYLHCAAGGRCLKAADLLKAAGFESRPLKPGYDDLLKSGFQKAK